MFANIRFTLILQSCLTKYSQQYIGYIQNQTNLRLQYLECAVLASISKVAYSAKYCFLQ